jgi:hypothetical protein
VELSRIESDVRGHPSHVCHNDIIVAQAQLEPKRRPSARHRPSSLAPPNELAPRAAGCAAETVDRLSVAG